MADKQQNITVNYKFNTADIERASAFLSRANQASNQLQQSGQKAGDNISAGFNKARQSIISMETQLARLKTMIQVSSDPKRIADLSNQYKVLKTQIDAANKSAFETPKAIKATGTAAQTATQSFGGLITAVRAFITAGIVKEVFDLSLNMAKLAGNVEGVDRAFNRAFPNSKQLLNELRKATRDTVGDFELMQRSLQAKNLGVAVEQLPALLEFAAVRAQQTGQSVDYLVESIVNGIGRKSPLILDNLGISAVRLKEKFDGAALASQSVGDVTKAVAEIAGEEMQKMGGYVETAATKVAQLGASFTRLKEQASEAFSGEGGISSFVKEYVDSFALGFEAINKNISVEELANQKRIEASALISEQVFAQNALTESKEENIKTIEDEIARLTQELGVFAKGREFAEARIKNLTDEYEARKKINGDSYLARVEFEKQLSLEKRLRDSRNEDIALDQEILKLLQGRLRAMKEINEEQEKGEPSGIISRKQKEIELLQEQIKLTNNLDDLTRRVSDDKGNNVPVVGRLIQQLEIAQAELADLQRAFSTIDIKPLDLKLGMTSDELEKMSGQIDTLAENVERLGNLKVQPIVLPEVGQTMAKLDTFWTEFGEFWNDNWRDLVADSAQWQADAINNLLETEIDAMQAQMSALKQHYQERQELAGDNERAKSELRIREDRELQVLAKRQFEREKSLRKAQVIVDGAAAAIKAFVTAPNVYVAIAQAAFIAASVVAQLRNIEKAQPRFAKGVIDLQGPGTGTSDSIPARLSKGESVMTAWETKHAGDVLKDVRAKKLDNKALREMKQGRAPIIGHQQFDDAKIIQAINANKPPDVVKQSNLVYEVRQHTETMRRKQRAKSMNI